MTSTTRIFRAPIVSAALSAAVVAWTAPAQAHAKLVSSDPSANATIAAPKNIHVQFSEEIAKRLSSLKLTDTDGNAVAIMSMDSKDAKSLDIMPGSTLAPGLYTVTWTAVATDDGHKTSGNFSFTVK